MPQLFPGQGVLEGVMAGRMNEARLAAEQAQVPDIQAQAKLRQIQAQAAMMDLAKQQRTEQTLQGLYQNKDFAASPLDRQLEVLGQSLMPFDPDSGLKALDKSNVIKQQRIQQEQFAKDQQVLSSIFAGTSPDQIDKSTTISPDMLDKAARYYGARGMDKEAAAYVQRADDMRKTQIAMAEAGPKLKKILVDTDHVEAETDALRAKQQHGGMETKDIVHAEDALRKDAEAATKPTRTTLSKIQSVRNLIGQESKAAPEQVRQGLVGLFDDIRATNVLYKESANYGDVVDRGENIISRALTGEPTAQYRQEVASMLDDMENKLIRPKLNEINGQYEKIAKDRNFDPSHVIIKEGDYSKPAEAKPAPKSTTTGKLSPIQEDWIGRALKANPGMSRADIITEGKKRGKL